MWPRALWSSAGCLLFSRAPGTRAQLPESSPLSLAARTAFLSLQTWHMVLKSRPFQDAV